MDTYYYAICLHCGLKTLCLANGLCKPCIDRIAPQEPHYLALMYALIRAQEEKETI